VRSLQCRLFRRRCAKCIRCREPRSWQTYRAPVVAAYRDVSVPQVYREIREGKIRAEKVGRMILIRGTELRRLLGLPA
jgi:excisionase family DNA binding protein